MAVTRAALQPVPFAVSGLKNTIPVSDPGGGAASFELGFPGLTMTPIGAGGVPPAGRDFNGILFDLSSNVTQMNAGLGYYYNADFAAAIGGYSAGALLVRADDTGFWFNTAADNENNPDSSGEGSGWVPAWNYGLTAITGLTNAQVTLNQSQYSKPIITLAGTLTGNINIIFPAFRQSWIVANNTTGAFTVTAKTASGAGATVPQGLSTVVWGDGTNIYELDTVVPAASVTNAMLANMAGNTVKMRNVASTGSPVDVVLAASQLIGRGATGNAGAMSLGTTLAFSGTTLDVALAGVANSNLADMAANTVKMRNSDSAGTPHDVPLAASQLIGRGATGTAGAMSLGTTLAFSGITLDVAAAGVANSNLAVMAANTVKANATASSASPGDVALGVSQLLGRGGSGNIAAITLGNALTLPGGQLAVTNATTSQVGVAELATVAETPTTDATRVVTPNGYYSCTIGWGQTWQDVSGSRAINTAYQNATGKPIEVGISWNNIAGSIEWSPNGSSGWVTALTEGGAGGAKMAHIIIPPGTYYRTPNNFSAWTELR